MAEKDFGVKRINLIGVPGTPTITSPNNLNINAVNVAISTDISIGGQVSSNIKVSSGYSIGIGTTNPTSKLHVIGDVLVSGIVTAIKFVGDGSLLTNIPGSSNSVYSNVAGIATYANTSGVSTFSGYSNRAGIATYANTSGIATYANTSGVSTFSGYSNVAGIATYAASSGIATTATTALGFSTTASINTTGIITATKYYGDGSSLTGIIASGSGVVIKSNGSTVGTAGTIDFTSNLSVTFGAGIATVAATGGGGNTGYANTSGVSTFSGYSNVAGIATYAAIAGYSTSSGISTYATSSGIATYATNAGIATYATTAGIATYATNAGIATQATKLQNSRTFEITGDIVGSPISFDGTGNVSIAATIQPNSVALGSDTTGDYVQSITGTANQISVSATSGESSTPILSIPNQFTIPQDVIVTRDLQVNRNLNVIGNVTIGGTSASIFAQELKISDPDIVLGVRTDVNGNDISNDNTANHGGVAVASTEGTPLVQLFIAGIETTPATYKKIMWFKSGTFAGLGTDAWLTNYAFGVGTTQMPPGARFAAGNFVVGQDDIRAVRNINSTGIITATQFVGSFVGNVTTATYAQTAGIATYATSSGIATYSNTSGLSTFSGYSNTSGIATYATSSGIATYSNTSGLSTFSEYSNTSGIATYADYAGIATYAELSGISTNVIGGIGSITQLNVSGVGSISIINGNTLDIVGDTNLYNANLVGITTLGFFSDVFYLNKSVKLEENTKYYTVHKELFVGAGHSLTIGDGASITVDRFNNLDDVNADSLTINGNTLYGSSTSTTNSISTVGIHSALATANYRSVEYTIQVTRGNKFHVTKILALHNNTLAYSSEYGTIFNNSSLATFDVDVSGGNMRLLVTPISSLSTQYKINFIAIKI